MRHQLLISIFLSTLLFALCLASPFQLSYALDCTFTAYTANPISQGPTSTIYATTQTVTQQYNCHGCEDIEVIPFGHIFVPEQLTPTTTITAWAATTITSATCSSSECTNGHCHIQAHPTEYGGIPKYNTTCGEQASTLVTGTSSNSPFAEKSSTSARSKPDFGPSALSVEMSAVFSGMSTKRAA